MNKIIYNCVILRFRPYRDIGEFVNIGAAIAFPQLNRFEVKIDNRTSRITSFFPEINRKIIREGKRYIDEEFKKVFSTQDKCHEMQEVFNFSSHDCNNAFHYIASIKEGVFIFSDVITGITDDVDGQLGKIFDFHVKRNFRDKSGYYEQELESQLRKTFVRFNVSEKFKLKRIGDDNYNVSIPFYSEYLAIKPLYFDRKSSTEVYEHGDIWTIRLKRLKDKNEYPSSFLFPIKEPKNINSPTGHAYSEVKAQFEDLKVQVIPFEKTEAIIDFIRKTL
jgi:hypothetical protein